MMKNIYLLTLALLLPLQALAVEKDSVYTWGAWAQGIQPAAGPVAQVTPPPVQTTNVNIRANETGAFNRQLAVVTPVIPPIAPIAPPVVTPLPVTPTGDPRQRGK